MRDEILGQANRSTLSHLSHSEVARPRTLCAETRREAIITVQYANLFLPPTISNRAAMHGGAIGSVPNRPWYICPSPIPTLRKEPGGQGVIAFCHCQVASQSYRGNPSAKGHYLGARQSQNEPALRTISPTRLATWRMAESSMFNRTTRRLPSASIPISPHGEREAINRMPNSQRPFASHPILERASRHSGGLSWLAEVPSGDCRRTNTNAPTGAAAARVQVPMCQTLIAAASIQMRFGAAMGPVCVSAMTKVCLPSLQFSCRFGGGVGQREVAKASRRLPTPS